jgi:hypothetical protein
MNFVLVGSSLRLPAQNFTPGRFWKFLPKEALFQRMAHRLLRSYLSPTRFLQGANMRQSKGLSSLLMGGILSVAMVGFVPMVYAQAGGGGAAGGAAGGTSGGAMGGSEGMGA